MSTTAQLMHRMVVMTLVAALLSAAGCIEYLEPGEHGTPRYFGEIKGEAPLNLFPPIADREGNVYVLFGSADSGLELTAYVGQTNGSWTALCQIHKGVDRGVHGWVGRTATRAWYWSGDALVEMSGPTGSCSPVLDQDPTTAANLRFRGISPHVRETPSRTTLVALVQSAVDRVPFFAVVDLNLARFAQLRSFEPAAATEVEVVGTGADPDSGTSFMVVRYLLAEQVIVEAIFLDREARELARVSIANADEVREDDIQGFLQSRGGDLVAGLLADGRTIAFDRSRGEIRAVDSFVPVGVHRWDNELWLAGVGGGRPVVASIGGDGSIGAPLVWGASETAAQSLAPGIQVLDERNDPRVLLSWSQARSAIGQFPFLSPHSPHRYAIDTTAWLIAGPAFNIGGGGEIRTSVALAPVGIDYP
jgi:hypothetical protein